MSCSSSFRHLLRARLHQRLLLALDSGYQESQTQCPWRESSQRGHTACMWRENRGSLPGLTLKPYLLKPQDFLIPCRKHASTAASWQGGQLQAFCWRWRWWGQRCWFQAPYKPKLTQATTEGRGGCNSEFAQISGPSCLGPGISPPRMAAETSGLLRLSHHSSPGSPPVAADTGLRGTQLQRQIWAEIVNLQSQTLWVEWGSYITCGAIKTDSWDSQTCRARVIPSSVDMFL